MPVPCHTPEPVSLTAHSTQRFFSFIALSHDSRPFFMAFLNKSFSYHALLFFLFTTFVAAGPVTKLQKRYHDDPQEIMGNVFLLSDGFGAWVRPPSWTPQDKLIEEIYFLNGLRGGEVVLEVCITRADGKKDLYQIKDKMTVHQEPGPELLGQWVRRLKTIEFFELPKGLLGVKTVKTVNRCKHCKATKGKVTKVCEYFRLC
ncbi:hypothetical protein F5887DRAFT_978905 [Amanita rubescens]|nr:hypothetical protein F5887DRAFT_978905 [Amanita rubescens]